MPETLGSNFSILDSCDVVSTIVGKINTSFFISDFGFSIYFFVVLETISIRWARWSHWARHEFIRLSTTRCQQTIM